MDLQENEIAKKIDNFPTYYITNQGRVWSACSNRWLKPTINKRGNHARCYVSLGRGNKFYVHQLVAKAFIDNPNNYTEVDHIDANGLNNNVENLRWVTHNQNLKNENTVEQIKKNTGYYIEIVDIETGELFYGYEEVAKKYNVSKATVSKHINNKVQHPRWQATGKRINPKNLK